MTNGSTPTISSPYIRIAAVWTAMLLIWLLLHSLRERVHGVGYTIPGHVQSAVLAALLAVSMVATARRWLDGGTLASMGLPLSPKAAVKPLAVGALSFLLPSALGLAIVLGLGWAGVTPLAAPGEILAFLPLLIVLVFLYEALPEELAFRGYIYRAAAERHPRIVAVVAQALLFGLWGAALWSIHLGAPSFERLMLFTAIGFVLGLVRVVTGSVWATVGLHTAFQTVAQLLLNEERGHFTVTGTEAFQLVVLGIVPFALATTIAERVYRRQVAWREPEGRSCTS